MADTERGPLARVRQMQPANIDDLIDRELRRWKLPLRARRFLRAVVRMAHDLETWHGHQREIAEKIARMTNTPPPKTLSTIARAQRDLEAAGLLEVDTNNGTASVYRVRWAALLDGERPETRGQRSEVRERDESPAAVRPQPARPRQRLLEDQTPAPVCSEAKPRRWSPRRLLASLAALIGRQRPTAGRRTTITAVTDRGQPPPLTAVNPHHPTAANRHQPPPDRGQPPSPDRSQPPSTAITTCDVDESLKTHLQPNTCGAPPGGAPPGDSPPEADQAADADQSPNGGLRWGRKVAPRELGDVEALTSELFPLVLQAGYAQPTDRDLLAFVALAVFVRRQPKVGNTVGFFTSILDGTVHDQFQRGNWRRWPAGCDEDRARELLKRIGVGGQQRPAPSYLAALAAENDERRAMDDRKSEARRLLQAEIEAGS